MTIAYADGDPFVLVVNGDCTEGIHHDKEQLVIQSNVAQWVAAQETLSRLVNAASSTYFTEGTRCHTLDGEHDLAESFKAVRNPSGSWAWPRLKLTMNRMVYSFRHHIGTTGSPYLEANALGRAVANERLESLNAGETPTDIVCAAHRHVYGQVINSAGMAVVSPSWQFPTRHVYKVKADARPCVGAVIFDARNQEYRTYPTVVAKTYKPLPDKGISLDTDGI